MLKNTLNIGVTSVLVVAVAVLSFALYSAGHKPVAVVDKAPTKSVSWMSSRTEIVQQSHSQTTFNAWCDYDYKDGTHSSRYLGQFIVVADLGPNFGFNISDCVNK